jgi:hypothetical protein
MKGVRNNECPCGAELVAAVVKCVICSQRLCLKCVISSDEGLPLCIFCTNDQHCALNNKNFQHICQKEGCDELKCANAKGNRVCPSVGCNGEIEFCKTHAKKCKFCSKYICSSANHSTDSCNQHIGVNCSFCKRKAKNLYKCNVIECNNYSCHHGCRFLNFEDKPSIRISTPWEVCKFHKIQCTRPTYRICNGYYYPLLLNKCDFPGCSNHSCDCCTFLLNGITKYACDKHIRVCGRGTCCNSYAEHCYGMIKWCYSKQEKMCYICFNNIRPRIETFLLVLKRLGMKIPKPIIEKILILGL